MALFDGLVSGAKTDSDASQEAPKRVTVKGSELSPDVSYVEWDEDENLKNQQLVVYNLPDLYARNFEFAHPYFDQLDTQLKVPDREDVVDYLNAGHDLVIILPNEPLVDLEGEDRDGGEAFYPCNPLAWLPFRLEADFDEHGDLVGGTTDDSFFASYFGEEFEWQVSLKAASQTAQKFGYSDPRPRQRKGVAVTRPGMAPPQGPEAKLKALAVNNVGDPIAAAVSLLDPVTDTPGGRVVGYSESRGNVFLIPRKRGMSSDRLVSKLLKEYYGLDVEEAVPEWVDDYKTPSEERLRTEIEQLQSRIDEKRQQIESEQWYKRLLYENDDRDKLRDAVLKCFREVGFMVTGEKPGKRDGAIELPDTTIILEITGTTGGAKGGKVRELHNHVEDAQEEGYGQNHSGLLVVNHSRYTDPAERDLHLNGVKERLEKRNYKLMTSLALFGIMHRFHQGSLTKEDITQLLVGEDYVIDRPAIS